MSASPYAKRLRQAIAAEERPSETAFLQAELAAYLGRVGQFDEADRLLADLRSRYGDGHSGRVSIMIMCAEAQVVYFRDLGERARDRMARAQLLAVALRDPQLSALSSAWLAHICFNTHRHGEMARAMRTCIATTTSEDHPSACRMALTLGDAFLVAGDEVTSSRWYGKAHNHATVLGDHSAVAALVYNRTALGVFQARVRQASDADVSTEHLASLDAQLRSAANYQHLADLRSLQILLDNAGVSLDVLNGRYAEAQARIEVLLATKQRIAPLDQSAVLRADHVLCLANCGGLIRARAELDEMLNSSVINDATVDDQIVALFSLAGASQLCGSDDLTRSLIDRGYQARADYSMQVRELSGLLEEFKGDETLDRL